MSAWGARWGTRWGGAWGMGEPPAVVRREIVRLRSPIVLVVSLGSPR